MAAQPVEWVLVVFYGPSAHRATYGRLANTKYTKDYIQLSKKAEFLKMLRRLFPSTTGADGTVSITYKWPKGTTPGTLIFNSSDRPHLKWETSLGAPKVWKMSLSASDSAEETIPGDPTHTDFEAAESEWKKISSRGAGQPYLMVVKLHDEPNTLHLRTYLDNPSGKYAWANLGMVPTAIQELADKTSQNSALAWETFASGGELPNTATKLAISKLEVLDTPVTLLENLDADTSRALAAYLSRPGYGIFFDPSHNHDAWIQPPTLSEKLSASIKLLIEKLEAKYPSSSQGDAAAEVAQLDPNEVEIFQDQIKDQNYSVADSIATLKTRGSAQRAFANAVKSNYKNRCAITGIETKEFLIASHIVPWSEDQSIRLDPSNGICLSLLMDKAFETGHLFIENDYTIRINWIKVGNDLVLRSQFEFFDGKKLTLPKAAPPRPEYLQRRRSLITN